MEDGDHVKAIRHHTVDQAIRVDDQFPQVRIVIGWHDAPRVRVINELHGAVRKLVDDTLGVERCIALDVLVDAIEVGLRLGRPDHPHSDRPYLARTVLTSSPRPASLSARPRSIAWRS